MKERLCWFMVFMMVMVGGCATGYTRIEQAPEIPFGEYKAIQVPDLKGSRQIPQEAPPREAHEPATDGGAPHPESPLLAAGSGERI